MPCLQIQAHRKNPFWDVIPVPFWESLRRACALSGCPPFGNRRSHLCQGTGISLIPSLRSLCVPRPASLWDWDYKLQAWIGQFIPTSPDLGTINPNTRCPAWGTSPGGLTAKEA